MFLSQAVATPSTPTWSRSSQVQPQHCAHSAPRSLFATADAGELRSLNGKLRAKLLNDQGFTVILSMVAPDPAARELVGAERREELGMGMSKDLG